jgi:hypothetical protein
MLGLSLTLALLRVMRLGDCRGSFYVAFPIKLAIWPKMGRIDKNKRWGLTGQHHLFYRFTDLGLTSIMLRLFGILLC